MGDKITSHGQQGGITAGQVNMNGAPSDTHVVSKKRSWGKLVAGVLAGLAAVAGILEFFGVFQFLRE